MLANYLVGLNLQSNWKNIILAGMFFTFADDSFTMNCIHLNFLFSALKKPEMLLQKPEEKLKKTVPAWYEYLPEPGESCNQIVKTWYLTANIAGLLTTVLIKICVVLWYVVHFVSACFINVFYACCIFSAVFYKREK